MTLAAGARLGPYEILAPLGVGGMGEGTARATPSSVTKWRSGLVRRRSPPA